MKWILFLMLVVGWYICHTIYVHESGNDEHCSMIASIPCHTLEHTLSLATEHEVMYEIHMGGNLYVTSGTLNLPCYIQLIGNINDEQATIWLHDGTLEVVRALHDYVVKMQHISLWNREMTFSSTNQITMQMFNVSMHNMTLSTNMSVWVHPDWIWKACLFSDVRVDIPKSRFISISESNMYNVSMMAKDAALFFKLKDNGMIHSSNFSFPTMAFSTMSLEGNRYINQSIISMFGCGVYIHMDVFAYDGFTFDYHTKPSFVLFSHTYGLGYIPSQASNWEPSKHETFEEDESILFDPSYFEQNETLEEDVFIFQ
jgi:hypothetical protein